jgi:transposase InsO family protein
VASVCRLLGMSRQNFYARRKRRERRQVDGDLVEQLVKRERQVQPRLGGRKLRVVLKEALAEAGVKVGRDRFFETLRQRRLLLEAKRSEHPRTTNSYHTLPVFRNLIRDLKVSQPNEVWLSDLTYLRTAQGFMFLSLTTDKMSRDIVGHHCGDSLESQGCLESLKRALRQLPEGLEPIHHSDRGSQYCCHEFVKCATQHGVRMSMTEKDHCAENAQAERVNGILKGEYGLDREFPTKEACYQAVNQAIALYRTRRPHTALGYRIPAEVHRAGVEAGRAVNNSPSPRTPLPGSTAVRPQGGASSGSKDHPPAGSSSRSDTLGQSNIRPSARVTN